MPSKKKPPAPPKEELLEMFNRLGTIRAVADELGRSRRTVSDWFRRAGLKLTTHGEKAPTRRQMIQVIKEQDGNLRKAAASLGISYPYFDQLRHRYDIGEERVRRSVGTALPTEIATGEEEVSIEYVRLVGELKKIRKENRDLRRAISEDAEFAGLVRMVAEANRKPPFWRAKLSKAKRDENVLCVAISDIHLGEVIDPSAVHGWNEFNRDIAEARLETLFRNVIYLSKAVVSVPITSVCLFILGDLISGTLHEEHRDTNDLTNQEAVLLAADLLEAGIRMIQRELKLPIQVCGVVGNHSRTSKKPRHKKKVRMNQDWLIYSLLVKRFQGDDFVRFDIPEGTEGSITLPGGFTYSYEHGDEYRGGSGIAGAWSPLMLGMHRKTRQHQQAGDPFHYSVLGHWHQRIWDPPLIVNGSVKGFDEYDLDKRHTFRVPEQTWWLHDPERGATLNGPIFCESAPRRRG